MIIADMHCDTLSRLYANRQHKTPYSLRSNPFQLDLEKMKQSGYILQNFAVFVDFGKTSTPYDDCAGQIALFQEEAQENQDSILPAASYQEIKRNMEAGKISALLTIEEGALCQGSLERLQDFYRLGVRMMTFTWNYPNCLGSPAEPADHSHSGGLTPLGISFLTEMERIGMIPDVSHLSDEGIQDVCRYAKKPFCASHSNARSLCHRNRNLPDPLIRSIGAQGGIIGVNYYGPFLSSAPNPQGRHYSYAKDIAAHIRHISNLGGISCIGLGSDFDGMDDNLEISHCGRMDLLIHALQKAGFHNSEIDKICFQNILAFYRELL
ncbi:dipeptidase [Lachnospiraceae bacterium 29-84]